MRKAVLIATILALAACGGGSPTSPSIPIPTPAPTPTPTPIPIFVLEGSGDTVFDLPVRIKRIKIQATYNGTGSNFIVYIAGSPVVNEILGTHWTATTFEGTYLITGGGVVEIKHSSGVAWTFTEVRP